MAAKQDIKVVITAQDKTKGAFQSVNSSVKNTSTGFGKLKMSSAALATGFIALGVGVLAVGKAVLTAAADFQSGMSNVSTLLDTTTEDMKAMSNAVLEISKRVPVAAGDLTDALFDIRSAGISAADAMLVLEKSAQLGVAGLGTTKEAANLATSAINAFGFSGEEIVTVMDQIQLTSKAGKTNISELAQSFGNVAGVAKTAGVEFSELMAATAALTTTGQKASVAQTQLRASILAIQAPTSNMNSLIQELGFETGSAMIEQLGLVESMRQLNEVANGDVEVLKKAFGSVEALGAALALSGEQGDTFNGIMEEMRNSAGTLDTAFAKQNETFNAQVQLLKNELHVAMVNIGNVVIPLLIVAFDLLRQTVDIIMGTFRSLFELFKVGDEETSIFTEFVNILTEAYNQVRSMVNDEVIPAFQELFIAMEPLMPAFELLAKILGVVLVGAAGQFVAIIKSQVMLALTGLKMIIEGVTSKAEFFKGVFDRIKATFQSAIDKIVALINKLRELKSAMGNVSLGGIAKGAMSALTPFATGGIVTQPTAALIGEAGPEAVIPLDKAGGMGGTTVNINGGNYLSEDAAEGMGDLLVNMLRKEIRI